MKSRDHFNLTSATIRSTLFSRGFTLSLSKVLLCLRAEVLTSLQFTIAGGDLVHDAEINAYLRARSIQRHREYVHAAHAEPPFGSLSLHRDRFRFASERAVKVGLDLANTLQVEATMLSFQFPAAPIFPLKWVKSTGRLESRKP
jgi:hypothetical protein